MSLPGRWLLAESPSLIAILDRSLTCRDLSRYWRERLGLPAREELALPFSRLFDLESGSGLTDKLEAVLNGGSPITEWPVELPGTDRSSPGRLSAWLAQESVEVDSWLVVAITDTSEIEEAMRDLMRIESQHQLILSAAGEGVYGLDAEGRMTFGNTASYEILGWKVSEIHGKKAHDVHHHSHQDGTPYPREECPIYAALKDGEVHRVDDEVFWHTDGSPVPVEYTSTPIMKDGKPDGAVVVFRDISKRKEIECEREAAYEQVKALKEELEQERDYLRDEIDVTINFGDIIGQSGALKRALAKVEAVARTSANVMVLGESGVGKEMIARAVHSASERSDKSLIKVNCASIPGELFESEFFGHVRGAFTGAHKDRIGRFQLANGGTIFLDEVGEIPMSLQGKLLRALQEQEFERVGDDRTMSVDVRVVAATNRDLEAEVAAGRFREDLYYRLTVFPIELPPLRQRTEDIVPLAAHFLTDICTSLGRSAPRLTRQQSDVLLQHQWPGNIRELRNVIERAVILTGGSRLRLDLALGSRPTSSRPGDPAASSATDFRTEEEFRELEKQNLVAALRSANGRVWGPDGAAAMLGIKPSTLTYRMNAFGIEKNRID